MSIVRMKPPQLTVRNPPSRRPSDTTDNRSPRGEEHGVARAIGRRETDRCARALRRPRSRQPEARRGRRTRRDHRGSERPRVPRLRRRHRLPEPRARAREGRRSGARAGRPLPPPDVDGRLLRGLRRGLPPARRELAVRGRVEEHAHQQRRRGRRERRQDLARGHRPAGGAGLRPRLPRAHAARDDDDLEARLQEDVRAVRARDLPRRGALRVPRHLERRRDRGDRARVQDRRGSRVGGLRRARARAGRGRLHPDAARLPGAPQGAARPLRDPLRGRRDPVRLRPHRDDVGDRALRRAARPRRRPARRSAAACRWRP